MKSLVLSAVAFSLVGLATPSKAEAWSAADWNALQSKAGYDQIFARVTKGVEPTSDYAPWDLTTHWYPPNMIVTKDEQPAWQPPGMKEPVAAVFLGSSICAYFPPNGDKPSRVCVNNKGEEWSEFQNDWGGWTLYQRIRSAWLR
jgi:hypothetical protein